MHEGFRIGEKVSWMTVNGPRTGRIEAITEKGITICLGNGKTIVADFRSLKKFRTGEDGQH